jgi:hypothetical protein
LPLRVSPPTATSTTSSRTTPHFEVALHIGEAAYQCPCPAVAQAVVVAAAGLGAARSGRWCRPPRASLTSLPPRAPASWSSPRAPFVRYERTNHPSPFSSCSWAGHSAYSSAISRKIYCGVSWLTFFVLCGFVVLGAVSQGPQLGGHIFGANHTRSAAQATSTAEDCPAVSLQFTFCCVKMSYIYSPLVTM